MPNWLFIALFVISVALALIASFTFGYFFRGIVNQLQILQARFEAYQAEATDDSSAVIETTPNLIREKERKGQLDTEESQIVTVKSPQEVRAAKDRQLQADLDKLGR